MAGGKASPRQKMINMMYLVLTALLAINVSKEVINAFVVINKGLLQQKQTLEQKNDATIKEFANQMQINPKNDRIKKFNDQAIEIGKASKELNDYIEKMKIDLVMAVDGVDEAKAKEAVVAPDLVDKKDDYDKPTLFFGTGEAPGNTGKANELKVKLADFKKKLLSFVDAKNKPKIEKNLGILNLDDPKQSDQTGSEAMSTWEMQYFYHLPQSAALVELTKWQNIVRGAESELLTYVWDQISATAFKFDAVLAAVIPKSNFVTSGSMFEAEAFLAAYSTAVKPKIIYGASVDTVTGNVPGGVELPLDKIVNGKGMIQIPASGSGERTLGGVIKIMNPVTGEETPYPFQTKYNVAPPSATVSPTKMNVFYRGLDNPVSISVPGVAPNNITASCSGASMSGGNGTYIVKPGAGKECTITVGGKTPDGKSTSMGSFKFRIKDVPTPQIMWGGQKTGGKLGANVGASSPLIPMMEDFDFEVYSTINSFTVMYTVNGSLKMKACTGNVLPSDVSSGIRGLGRGSKVIFEDIKVTVPGGSRRTTSAVYTIQ